MKKELLNITKAMFCILLFGALMVLSPLAAEAATITKASVTVNAPKSNGTYDFSIDYDTSVFDLYEVQWCLLNDNGTVNTFESSKTYNYAAPIYYQMGKKYKVYVRLDAKSGNILQISDARINGKQALRTDQTTSYVGFEYTFPAVTPKTYISEIDLSIRRPILGGIIDQNPLSLTDGVIVPEPMWCYNMLVTSDTVFQDRPYAYQIVLRDLNPKPGYAFAEDVTVKINNETADVVQFQNKGVLQHLYVRKAYTKEYLNHTHDYRTVKKEATLTEDGSIEEVCECGDVLSTKTIYHPKKFTLSATSYTYDGETKTPTLTVKDSAGKTISTQNYTLTKASGRKNVGTYSYKVVFKGKYKGTKKVSFKINPKGTTLSTLTAAKAGFKATWKKQSTQTTGYQIQYSRRSSFTSPEVVTITKNTTLSKTVTKLSAKKKYYVRIRTYKTVDGTKYHSAWSKAKYVTTK